MNMVLRHESKANMFIQTWVRSRDVLHTDSHWQTLDERNNNVEISNNEWRY